MILIIKFIGIFAFIPEILGTFWSPFNCLQIMPFGGKCLLSLLNKYKLFKKTLFFTYAILINKI